MRGWRENIAGRAPARAEAGRGDGCGTGVGQDGSERAPERECGERGRQGVWRGPVSLGGGPGHDVRRTMCAAWALPSAWKRGP